MVPVSLTDDSGKGMGWFIIAKDAILFEESQRLPVVKWT